MLQLRQEPFPAVERGEEDGRSEDENGSGKTGEYKKEKQVVKYIGSE